jgi:hypothetical protein
LGEPWLRKPSEVKKIRLIGLVRPQADYHWTVLVPLGSALRGSFTTIIADALRMSKRP